jgi:hypothetical protein
MVNKKQGTQQFCIFTATNKEQVKKKRERGKINKECIEL